MSHIITQMSFFKERWMPNKHYDIFDALGPIAADIADLIPDHYITDFTPIADNLQHISINRYKYLVLFHRCGLKVSYDDLNVNLKGDTLTYMDDLYAYVSLYLDLELTVPTNHADNVLQVVLLKLPDKYQVLRTIHLLKTLHKIDLYITVLDALPTYMYEIMPYLLKRGHKWNIANNYFYLIVLAVASKHYPNMKPILIDIMQQLGIITISDPSTYILDAIDTYPKLTLDYLTIKAPALWFKIPTRDAIKCSNFTLNDATLIQKHEVILAYTNYEEHKSLSNTFETIEQWFVPTSVFMYKRHFTETTLSMEEVKDTYIIGYGTVSDHYLYSTYELEQAIKTDSLEWQLTGFPTRPIESQVETLLTILKALKLDTIIVKITEYFTKLNTMGRFDIEQHYMDFFKHIIEIGLFARRWKDYSDPFPYDKKISMVLSVNPAVHITPLIHKCKSIMEMWTTRPQFNTYIKNGLLRDAKFMDYMEEVFDNKECIRVASPRFINTGAYYLKQLYNINYCHPITNECLALNQLEDMSFISPEELRG
jgi:hypothetical protein